MVAGRRDAYYRENGVEEWQMTAGYHFAQHGAVILRSTGRGESGLQLGQSSRLLYPMSWSNWECHFRIVILHMAVRAALCSSLISNSVP